MAVLEMSSSFPACILPNDANRPTGFPESAGANRHPSPSGSRLCAHFHLIRWRDGNMRPRRCRTGLLPAEAKFRRVKGRREMPTFLKALESLVRAQPAGNKRDVA